MKAGSQFEGGSNSKCHWLWKYIECAWNFSVFISPQRKLERLWGQAEKKVGVKGERAAFVRMGDRYCNVILLEGNGRYYAIKEALGDIPDLHVEIRLIHFGQSQEVWSAIDAALRFSNLTPPPRSFAAQIADSFQG